MEHGSLSLRSQNWEAQQLLMECLPALPTGHCRFVLTAPGPIRLVLHANPTPSYLLDAPFHGDMTV